MADPVIIPGAIWQPADPPISTTPVAIRWIILHTIVGTVAGSIGGRHYHTYTKANGEFIQIQSLHLRSAASVEANPYSVAFVAEDKGPAFPVWSGNNVPPYTNAQVQTLIHQIAWTCVRYGLSTDAIKTSRWDAGPGCGWHRLGIPGNFPPTWPLWGQQSGGQLWSNTIGKACPGDNRIWQIVNIIIPEVKRLIGEEADVLPDTDAILYTAYHSLLIPGSGSGTLATLKYVTQTPSEARIQVQQGTAAGSPTLHTCKGTLQASGGLLDVVMPPGVPFFGSVWDAVPGGWGGANAPDERAVAFVWTADAKGGWFVSNLGGFVSRGNAVPYNGPSVWGQQTVGAFRNTSNRLSICLANGDVKTGT